MVDLLVKDVYNMVGLGVVLEGQVQSGVLRNGMKLALEGKTMTIREMEIRHQVFKLADEGDNVGITLADADYALLKRFKGKTVEFV